MRPVIRYQSQLLFRKSYKPTRALRIRPTAKGITYRPSRATPDPRAIGAATPVIDGATDS
jgi:hypothetical protein